MSTMEWKPIETAPKDKNLLLGWRSAEGVGHVGEGYWAKGFEGSVDEPPFPAGWSIPSQNYFNCLLPTHWMPLPPPPDQEGP